jgi:hypothetical protein
LLSIGVIATLVLGWQIAAFAGPIGLAQGFEDDDGNLIDDAAVTGIDWNSFDPVQWQPSPTTTPTRQADKEALGFTFKGIEDWRATTSDNSFAGGTKQDNDCASVISAKPPNKDDLRRIYLATTTLTSGPNAGDVFLDLAWVRIPQNTTSASAHIGFEFNQGETACAGGSGLVERTAGDLLIVYDFEGGSADPVITLRKWVTSGTCEVGSSSPPCWGPSTNLTTSGVAEAKVNVGTTVLDQLAPPGLASTTGTSVDQTLGDSEFGEAGINLTDAAGLNQCSGFGKAFAVSRSSGNSAQAQMKDLVGPADFSLGECVTNIGTTQGFIPQDTATITGQPPDGFNGTVDFRLYSGLACGGATPPAPLYQELDVPVSGTPATATTDNPGGLPSADPDDGFTITGTGNFSWRVDYDPADGELHPEESSCVEESRVVIDNDDTVAPNPLQAVTT